MTTFLTVNDGRIEIYADNSILDAPPAFVTDSAYEAARYLYDHRITDWSNPADEDGKPSAADEVMTQLAYIHHRELNRRGSR